MIRYVVGLLFNGDKTKIALIEKQRPNWQKGKWNGIGGKIEEGEEPLKAVQREFCEEAGALVKTWLPVVTVIGGDKWICHFFKARGEYKIDTMEDELVDWHLVDDVVNRRIPVSDQIPWIVTMALDHQIQAATIKYCFDWEDQTATCGTCDKPEIECRCNMIS